MLILPWMIGLSTAIALDRPESIPLNFQSRSKLENPHFHGTNSTRNTGASSDEKVDEKVDEKDMNKDDTLLAIYPLQTAPSNDDRSVKGVRPIRHLVRLQPTIRRRKRKRPTFYRPEEFRPPKPGGFGWW